MRLVLLRGMISISAVAAARLGDGLATRVPTDHRRPPRASVLRRVRLGSTSSVGTVARHCSVSTTPNVPVPKRNSLIRCCVLHSKDGTTIMTKRDELRERRDQILAKARAVAEKAGSEGRELTAAEAEQVNSALAEAKGIGATLAADDRNRALMSELDAQASSAAYDVLGGSGQHLALTGVHAKTMADRIIAGMPRDSMSTKTLAAGQQTTSSILLPQVIATGRPAVSVLDVLPARIVPPIYSFLRQNSRTLAAAPTPAYTAKPVSDVGVVGVENRLRVVATVSSPVDHFLVSDNTNLTAFVTQELVYAIRVCLGGR